MSKVFLFANSYVTNTIIMCAQDLFSFQIDEIFVLKENSLYINDIIVKDKNTKIKINVLENLITCVHNSDVIIMVLDDWIPINAVKSITEIALIHQKKVIKLDNPFLIPQNRLTLSIDGEIELSQKTPTILCISLSSISQQLFVECVLNRVISLYSDSFAQKFSSESTSLLSQILSNDVLNSNLKKALINESTDPDLQIYSIAFQNSRQLKENLCELKLMKADFVIIVVDNSFHEYKLLDNIIKYNIFSDLNIVIKSNYQIYDKRFIYYSRDRKYEDGHVLYINNDSFEEELRNSIFSQIGFPESFKEI